MLNLLTEALTDATTSEKPVLLGHIAGKGCGLTLLTGSSDLSSSPEVQHLIDEDPPQGWVEDED